MAKYRFLELVITEKNMDTLILQAAAFKNVMLSYLTPEELEQSSEEIQLRTEEFKQDAILQVNYEIQL